MHRLARMHFVRALHNAQIAERLCSNALFTFYASPIEQLLLSNLINLRVRVTIHHTADRLRRPKQKISEYLSAETNTYRTLVAQDQKLHDATSPSTYASY